MKKEKMVCRKCVCHGGSQTPADENGNSQFDCHAHPTIEWLAYDPDKHWCNEGEWRETGDYGFAGSVHWGDWEED